MDEPLRILFVSAEVAPFAKTGGLGDVIGALPKALATLGHDVRVVMPFYRTVREGNFALAEAYADLQVPLIVGTRATRVWQSPLPGSEESGHPVPVYFLEQDEFFGRPGLYGTQDGDYPDNAIRFTYLCRAALTLAARFEAFPHVVHCHDWQTGLIPAYLRVLPWLDARLSSVATVFTVHNLAYQGVFPAWAFPFTELPPQLFQPDGVEFFGSMSFMKAGLLYADGLTTVSPSYAEEICAPDLGFRLDGVLRARRSALTGILNGADYTVWSPEHDSAIAAPYSATDLSGKVACKKALLQMFDFPSDLDTPVIGMISRLVDQKGFDLVAAALDRLLALNVRFVILGSGYAPYEEYLTRLRTTFPEKIGVRLGFDDALAHQIEAGSDCFLMPSRYEPCGLNQLYSLRYGTIPIVRATGGLRDSVEPFNVTTGQGTGFVFEEASGEALLAAVNEALGVFANRPAWQQLVQNAMRQDFSWERSASRYVERYRQLLAAKPRAV
jgi:starch synthase